MKRFLIAVMTAAIAWPAMAADTSFICASTIVTGGSFNKIMKDWRQADFKQSQWMFKATDVERDGKKSVTWKIIKIGDKELNCISPTVDDLRCADGYNIVYFNKAKMRFKIFYIAGYTDDSDEDSATPTITLGKCSLM